MLCNKQLPKSSGLRQYYYSSHICELAQVSWSRLDLHMCLWVIRLFHVSVGQLETLAGAILPCVSPLGPTSRAGTSMHVFTLEPLVWPSMPFSWWQQKLKRATCKTPWTLGLELAHHYLCQVVAQLVRFHSEPLCHEEAWQVCSCRNTIMMLLSSWFCDSFGPSPIDSVTLASLSMPPVWQEFVSDAPDRECWLNHLMTWVCSLLPPQRWTFLLQKFAK